MNTNPKEVMSVRINGHAKDIYLDLARKANTTASRIAGKILEDQAWKIKKAAIKK